MLDVLSFERHDVNTCYFYFYYGVPQEVNLKKFIGREKTRVIAVAKAINLNFKVKVTDCMG